MPTLKPAVQLYTLQNDVKADFAGTVKKLADIGYKGVELAGYGSAGSAEAARRACDDAGVVACGAHVMIDRFQNEMEAVVSEMKTLGTKTVAVPWIGEDRRGAAYVQTAEFLQRAAVACREAGLTLCYHNHAFEFEPIPASPAHPELEGKDGMDVLFSDAAPDLKSELDVFWVKVGGHDPAAYVAKLGGRVTLLHLKDMAAGGGNKFAPVGEGTLDFPSIVAAGAKAGVEWGVVEQDNCYDTPPIEAVRTSFENLKKMGLIEA